MPSSAAIKWVTAMHSQEILAIFPLAGSKAAIFASPLTSAMDEFQINTPARQAAFLAQCGHESGQLRYVRELAAGDAYEGRKDLGNTQLGDGIRFKGRGLIQITGRANFAACGKALVLDLIKHPELLEEPVNACRSAAWFWSAHGLNELADMGDFLKISVRINGRNKKTGLPNGWDDRQALYGKAKEVLA